MNKTEQQAMFDEWAIVDVMGHQRYAGRVREQVIAGHGYIRVDVPEIMNSAGGPPRSQAMTKLFAPGAIHSITPCSEVTARIAAASIRHEPINRWDAQSAGYLPESKTPGPQGDDATGEEGPF